MRHIKTIILFVSLWSFANMKAQLSTNEKPVSFGRESEMRVKHRSENPIITMPQLDMVKITEEDKDNKERKAPPRFGYKHKVNYNLNNSGVWHELPNGDKLWQLNIVCPEAMSVNFCYDKFWLPEGGKFFVYSKDKKQYYGAFTSRNNKGAKEHLRGFATGLIYGSDVVLEYYQPKEVTTDAIISIDYIVHGYKSTRNEEYGFNHSGSCMVNVNCDEGYNWKTEKKAIARIIWDGNYYCSGSLINTTDFSGKPFFLTADHCVKYVSKDAILDSIFDYSVFYWNYEMPSCAGDTIEPPHYSTSGAIILANNYMADFALLRLEEDPKDLSNYIPCYLGWDNSGHAGGAGVCIHHPKGDVKKISTVDTEIGAISTYYYGYAEHLSADHWKVIWQTTDNGHGTAEQGSSGSPLLSAEHKVIGQLHGGYSNCGLDINEPDWFGKFSVSWTGNNMNNIHRRLDCWLDSLNTGGQTIEGMLLVSTTRTITENENLYGLIRVTGTGHLTIQSNIEFMSNSPTIVEAGGKLTIDGGKLSNAEILLKPGATLRVLNGGTIESRNGLKAPLGAIVEILHGKIS